jgi:hypothetical protein
MTTGPSGKRRPVAMVRSSLMGLGSSVVWFAVSVTDPRKEESR